jgi:hypothetical protein
MCVWSTLDTVRIHTATNCRVVLKTTLSVGGSKFNPHLPSGFTFLPT